MSILARVQPKPLLKQSKPQPKLPKGALRDWAYLTLCVALFEITNDPSTFMDDGAYKATDDYKLDKRIKRNFKRLIESTKTEYDKLPYSAKEKIEYYKYELLRKFEMASFEKVNLESLAITLWHARFKERNKPLHESLQWTREANIDYIYDLLEKTEIPVEAWERMTKMAYDVAGVM